jgi:ketosteroid isomerase-like protein
MPHDPASDELLRLTRKLLDAIANGDWKTYESLCDPTLSSFEPEGQGHLVEGLAFHRFYFDLAEGAGPRSTTIASPHIRVMGDVAVVSYTRLTQSLGKDDQPTVAAFNETRVWQRQEGAWRHVHFHRS